MKNKKIMLALILMMSATVSYAQNTNPLIGKWYVCEEDNSDLWIFEFTKTQLLIFDFEDLNEPHEVSDYKTDGRTITVDDDEKWSYKIQNGNNLIIIIDGETCVGKKIEKTQTNVTALTGVYELVNDVGIIQKFEFTDRTTVIAYSSFAGFTQKLAWKYRISGTNLIITTDRGTAVFEIIGDMVIRGDVMQGGIGQGRESIFFKK